MTAAPTIAGPGSETAVPSTRSGARATRDPYLDNAKFLLLVLVVVGHNWAMLIGDMRAARAAYMLIYAFHMPAFVLLCGYFSRNFTGRPDQVRRLITGVLIPYLVFEAAYSALFSLLRGGPLSITPTTPTYLCWFLAALFVWRLTAPVWRAVPLPLALSAAISLAAGMTTVGYELALPRVLQFLPWFVLGLHLRPEHFQMLRRRAVRHCGLAVFAAAAAGAWWSAPRARITPLLMQYSRGELGLPAGNYLLMRLGLFALAAALIAAFLAWVPPHRAAFTALGAATLYPFLLHGLVVKTAEEFGFYRVVVWTGLPGLLVLTLLAVALAVALSTVPVRRATRWLVEPRTVGRLRVRIRKSPALEGDSPAPEGGKAGGRTKEAATV